MNVKDRMKLVRTIEKMDSNKGFAKKLGIRDVSVFRKTEKPKECI